MNSIIAEIISVEVKESLSLVRLLSGKTKFTSIVIDTPKTANYLREGQKLNVIFKETEVIVGKGNNHLISLQNKFFGTIKKIESGDLLSRVSIDTDVGVITSIITNNAVNQLDLKKGVEVTAMVKTNEIMLSE